MLPPKQLENFRIHQVRLPENVTLTKKCYQFFWVGPTCFQSSSYERSVIHVDIFERQIGLLKNGNVLNDRIVRADKPFPTKLCEVLFPLYSIVCVANTHNPKTLTTKYFQYGYKYY